MGFWPQIGVPGVPRGWNLELRWAPRGGAVPFPSSTLPATFPFLQGRKASLELVIGVEGRASAGGRERSGLETVPCDHPPGEAHTRQPAEVCGLRPVFPRSPRGISGIEIAAREIHFRLRSASLFLCLHSPPLALSHGPVCCVLFWHDRVTP